MLNSIRSIVYVSFILITIFLFFVITLGVRQLYLSRNYAEITALSERTIFTFLAIREQALEALISEDYRQLRDIIPDIEQLNSTISRLYDSEMLPGHYKLAMTDKIDLTGLVIRLRQMSDGVEDKPDGPALLQEMRLVAESLMKVDRIIARQIRDAVVNFQLTMIGTLGVLLSCAGFGLILLYQKAVKPQLLLSQWAASADIHDPELVCPPGAGLEIEEFVISLQSLMEQSKIAQAEQGGMAPEEMDVLGATINETTNGLNSVINYAELLLGSEGDTQLSEEQREMLRSIITQGERVARNWQAIGNQFNR